MGYIETLGLNAKACKTELANASAAKKNDALLEIAHILRRCAPKIIEANQIDLENAVRRNMPPSMRTGSVWTKSASRASLPPAKS